MRKIFMISYGGGHSKILLEIYKKIKKTTPNFEVVYLAMTTSKRDLLKEKLNFKTLKDYKNILEEERKNKFLLEEFGIEYEFNEFVSEEEHRLYNNICLDELLEKYDRKDLKKLLLKYGRRIYLPVTFMKRILKLENPDLIITTNAPRFERASLIAGKQLNIPTISIEDLYGEPSKIDIEIDCELNENLYSYSKTFGNYICVIDELAKINIKRQIIEENKIFITGNPNFDKSVRRKLKEINNKNITNKKNKILYLAQPTKFFDVILNKIQEIALKRNDFIFIIKLHPNQKIKLQNTSNFILMDQQLEELILESDLVITEHSTSGIEALILERKVMSIQIDSTRRCPIPFEKFSNTWIEKDLLNLENSIGEFISKEFDYEKNNFSKLSIATDKILEIILKLLNGENL